MTSYAALNSPIVFISNPSMYLCWVDLAHHPSYPALLNQPYPPPQFTPLNLSHSPTPAVSLECNIYLISP